MSQTQKRSICDWCRSDLELGLHGLRSFCHLIHADHERQFSGVIFFDALQQVGSFR
jgi:hypothetical protein